jgi:hypothetical protein
MALFMYVYALCMYMGIRMPFLQGIYTHIRMCLCKDSYTAVCVYVHTYMYTYIRTCIHTCTHIYIHTYIHTHVHTHIHTQTQSERYILACMHVYIHTHIHTYTHVQGAAKKKSKSGGFESMGFDYPVYKVELHILCVFACMKACMFIYTCM